MLDFLPADLKEMLLLLAIVFCFVLYVIYGYIPDNLYRTKRLVIAKESSQDEEYVAIRRGMEACKNIHLMYEFYTAILAYKNKYPESKIDVKILIEQYDAKCSRF